MTSGWCAALGIASPPSVSSHVLHHAHSAIHSVMFIQVARYRWDTHAKSSWSHTVEYVGETNQ